MYNKKRHILSLLIAKKAIDKEQGREVCDKILLVTAQGVIEGKVRMGLDIPEEGDLVERLTKMQEENPGEVNMFDVAKVNMLTDDSDERPTKDIEAIDLYDVVIRDPFGNNTFSIPFLTVFIDQVIGSVPLDNNSFR